MKNFKKTNRVALSIVIVALVLSVVSISVFTQSAQAARGNSQAEATNSITDGRYTYLVLGKDRASGLTDVIMLFSVDTEDSTAAVVQIPRDTYARYSESGYKKINGALSSLGASGLCRFIEEFVPKNKITLLGTDIFDSLSEYIKRDIMKATISQNQEEVGRLAASYAYEYINKTHSYGHADWKPEHVLLVDPTLLLKANIE